MIRPVLENLPEVLLPVEVRDYLGYRNRRADQVLTATLEPAGLRVLRIRGRLRVLRSDLSAWIATLPTSPAPATIGEAPQSHGRCRHVQP